MFSQVLKTYIRFEVRFCEVVYLAKTLPIDLKVNIG